MPATAVRRRPALPATALAPGLAGLAVLLQIVYPLTHGPAQLTLTIVIVAAFAAACLAHAAVSRTPAVALRVLAATAGIGFAAELIGVHTGVPFGDYRYTSVLGARLFGVPLIVALAWTMLAWPAAVAARRLARGRLARIAIGAWALAAADVFLDPQLVALRAWTWSDPSPHLPGVPAVPLGNFLGWLLVAAVLSAVLQQVTGDGPDGLGIALYVWLWLGWTVAQLFFLDQRGSAAWGFVAMGTVAAPLLARLARQRAGVPAS